MNILSIRKRTNKIIALKKLRNTYYKIMYATKHKIKTD